MLSVGLKNVVVSDDAKRNIELYSSGTPEVKVFPILEPVIKQLAVLKPTWTFVAKSSQRARDNVFFLDDFEVLENGEELGRIGREYGRHDWKIRVSNDRIAKKRERGSSYTTDDPKKAIARIKKEFGRMTVAERLERASEAAGNYTYQAHSRHERKLRPHETAIKDAAYAYLSGPGFSVFLQHLKDTEPSKYEQIARSKEQYDELHAEMMVLRQMRDSLGSDKSALIVRDFEQYIVRVGDKVTIYDDTTLPVDMRGKIGLLKLVEKEHFVTGAGCRVSDEVFVVTLDDEGEAK